MHWEWYDIFLMFAMWGVDRYIDGRVDKRLHAAGIALPPKPKWKLPPKFWRDARRYFVAMGLLFGGLYAFVIFAPPGPANEHPAYGILLVILFVVVGGLGIFWSRRDKRELARAAATSAIASAMAEKLAEDWGRRGA